MAVVKVAQPTRLLVTAPVLCDCYGFLLTTEPFCHWGLPDKHEIDFRVVRLRDRFGDHEFVRKTRKHIVRVSSRNVGTVSTLTRTMSHEMVHVAEHELKTKTPNVAHNVAFYRMSDEVCACHGYDRLEFADTE